MQGRTPTKDEAEYMDRVQALGCVVCLRHLGIYSPAEIHHIDGSVKPGCHYHVLPLCAQHHRLGEYCDARHKNKRMFEASYGTELDLYHFVVDTLDSQ